MEKKTLKTHRKSKKPMDFRKKSMGCKKPMAFYGQEAGL